MKEKVASAIADRVKNGEVLGIGTGSTVDLAIQAIGQRIREEKLKISALTTSYESTWACQQVGIQVLNSVHPGELDWGFDGADEVDQRLRLIKGRGGALYQEKLVSAICKKFIIIADQSKIVTNLGEKFYVPVEFTPRAYFLVERELIKLGAKEVLLRQATGKHGAIVTELGNLIFDVKFSNIADELEGQIKKITGVIESGIFTDHADEVLVAGSEGVRTLLRA